MKKHIPLIALIPLTILALTPPLTFKLDCTINSLVWLWAVFFSGFLAFAFLYQRVSVWLKLLVIWLYISCFLSTAPYMSFTMYWSAIFCAYYYLLCTKIEDWSLVRKAIQSLFFFIVLLIIMQLFGKDTLLNFNMKQACVLGTIGNYMILGSFVCVLSPFLLKSWLNWVVLVIVALISGSSGTLLAIMSGVGVLVWMRFKRARIWLLACLLAIPCLVAYKTGDFAVFADSGRFPIWKRTVEKIAERPLGYGIGTTKILLPLFTRDLESSKATVGEWDYENTKGNTLAWRRVHNSWLQFPFEVGIPGFILMMGWLVSIAMKCKDKLKIAGMAIVSVCMITAFPDRIVQGVLIMLAFLAYCGIEEKPCQA